MYSLVIDITELNQLRDELIRVEAARMPALQVAASNSVVLIRDRISRGLTSEGKQMQSKAKKKEGAYSLRHARARKKRNRQINVIDLNYTSKTIYAFKRIGGRAAFQKDAIDVGFDDPTYEAIAGYNNEMFGPAYDLSETEADSVFKDYLDEFNSELFR